MRQFRSDDTAKWKEGFGKGSAGDFIVTSNTTAGGGNLGIHYGSITGTSGATTATVPSGFSWLNKPCLIHQSQKTGAGNWELNVQTGISGTTATFKYPLQNNYTSGAQIVTINDYKNLTINSGVTVGATAWNGSTGGIIALMAKETITINGSINASGMGFRGGAGGGASGPSNNDVKSQQGEGYPGIGNYLNLSNGNGGGGSDGSGADGGNSGGGGGNANNGGNGGAGQGSAGIGGSAVGNSGLTSMFLGGAGGKGRGEKNGTGVGGVGGSGGGIIFLLAKNISITGSIVTTGSNGSNGNGSAGGGGAGAGGSVLLKGQYVNLGSNIITSLGGVGGTAGGGDGTTNQTGGAGSVGRIHLDYSKSYSGSTNPTLDVRQDNTIKATIGGANYYQYFL